MKLKLFKKKKIIKAPNNKVEAYVQEAINIANDNTHGYSQASRWPEQGTDFDCSSLTITVLQDNGYPVRTAGATYTGNMYSALLSCGFIDVTSQVNLSNCNGMERGDILLNYANHVAIYIGNNQLVHARSSEGNSIPGDQSGNEIRTQSYWNYPWDCVLRAKDSNTQTNTNTNNNSSILSIFKKDKDKDTSETQTQTNVNTTTFVQLNCKLPELQIKSKERLYVYILQAALVAKGYDIGKDGIDGEFGNNTLKGLKDFQQKNGLTVDGICGKNTWTKLLS